MARYIDADKLIAHLKDEIKACEPKFDGRVNGKSVAYGTELGLKAAISFAEALATADVVPRAEVDWIGIPVDVSEALKQRAVEKAKTEVAREIFKDIDLNLEDYIRGDIRGNAMVARLYSLKKKYTEGE